MTAFTSDRFATGMTMVQFQELRRAEIAAGSPVATGYFGPIPIQPDPPRPTLTLTKPPAPSIKP